MDQFENLLSNRDFPMIQHTDKGFFQKEAFISLMKSKRKLQKIRASINLTNQNLQPLNAFV